jgi:Concanavalin A-like lectin/glucanases superfamily
MRNEVSSEPIRTKTLLILGGAAVLFLLLAGLAFFLFWQSRQPVALWRADGNAHDSVGHNNGRPVNVTYTQGVNGLAFEFNGSNAYVRIPDSPALKPPSVTVEAWVRLDTEVTPAANSPGLQFIVFKKNKLDFMYEGYCLQKNRDENGRDFFRFLISSGSQQVMADSITDAEVDKWYHLAGTYDVHSGDLKLYVNGQLQATSHAGFALSYGRSPLFIGQTGEWWDGKFGGAIGEVAIYNRARSLHEIAADYQAGARGAF